MSGTLRNAGLLLLILPEELRLKGESMSARVGSQHAVFGVNKLVLLIAMFGILTPLNSVEATYGNGSVTVEVTASQIIIKITDPDGVGEWGLFGGSGREASGDGGGAMMVTITLPRDPHIFHSHSISYIDRESNTTGGANHAETWNIGQGGAPVVRKNPAEQGPALTNWGLLTLAMLILAAGAYFLSRRRREAV